MPLWVDAKKALYVNKAAENPLYSHKEPFYTTREETRQRSAQRLRQRYGPADAVDKHAGLPLRIV